MWRIEAPRLIAGLARMVGDLGRAEDLAQDALVAALETWPRSGVPDNPGAWLMVTARRRAIDGMRRDRALERTTAELGREIEREQMTPPDLAGAVDDPIGDDLLTLVFTTCHPLLSTDARVALTLRLLGGLATAEIARAFLVPEATVAQRIVRAKKTLSASGGPFEAPSAAELPERLGSVLEVVYLIFNEGYSATAGDDAMRPALCAEAMRLGRVLTRLAPAEPEVHGLVALMELQASRRPARTDRRGRPVLLLEQDRGRWDRLLIGRGLAALERARELGGARGHYALQAAIAACHARARRAAATDWLRIAALYDELCRVSPSPVIELNRAMAVSMTGDLDGALAIVDALADDPALRAYHLLPSARGDLLARLGRRDEARAELERAAGMTRNAREREALRERAARL